jgi:2-hydroxy-3-keto-5-methylthiopentenyl-1-phosphate phosphatase
VLLVVDWDGTVTETDTQSMVLEEFGDPELFRRAEQGLQSGELTLKECMELEYRGVRASLDAVNSWLLDHVRIRTGFHELAERRSPLILSSSFVECIEPLLRREGVELELRANSVEARPDGWRVVWRDEARCADCGEACKRGSLPEGEVVYVGDGISDRCAALAADRVFARDGLARYLDERGVPYEPFEDFRDVEAALGAGGGSA